MAHDKIELSKSEAYKIVFDDLIKCDLFKGIYDAKHGEDSYMYGVSAVMENIAMNISEDCYDKFEDEFMKNMTESQNRAEIDREFDRWIEYMAEKYGWDKETLMKQFSHIKGWNR